MYHNTALWLRDLFLAFSFLFIVYALSKRKSKKAPPFVGKPETEKYLTTLYFGDRSAGKTLHQAKEARKILRWLQWLYHKHPKLPHAIVYSVQKFSEKFEKEYLGDYLYYWTDVDELQHCPRKKCWKGKKKHRLHDAYIIFDDMSTILPPMHWQLVPNWLKKMFYQQAHFGIHILGSLVDPFVVVSDFRKCVDMAFRFRKIIGSKRPEAAKPPIKRIWGLYSRRKITGKDLWKYGDPSDNDVQLILAQEEQKAKITGGIVSDIFRHAGWYRIKKEDCEIYDTLQDVPEYQAKGFAHSELKCIDPDHPDCGYKKVYHELI